MTRDSWELLVLEALRDSSVLAARRLSDQKAELCCGTRWEPILKRRGAASKQRFIQARVNLPLLTVGTPFMMRRYLGFALLISAFGVAACGAGKPANNSRIPGPTSGTGGGGSGSSPSSPSGDGGTVTLNTPMDVDGGVPTDLPDYGTPLAARNTAAMAAQGTAWGLIATGDTGVSDVSPNLSHQGDSIVYTTTDYSPDGHPDAAATTADIHTVAYNNHLGRTSLALPGASDPNLLEYYPSYSGDDSLIAFTRAPNPGAATPDGPYYNRFGEVMVIPAAGGTAVPLAANDPVACGGDNVSVGLINSRPKWSPDVFTVGGKTYYFLVFSSARKYADEFSGQFTLPANPLSGFKGLNQSSQLYLAAVVVDNATGQVTSYPAVYIWNQNRTPGADGTTSSGLQYSNLTPAWADQAARAHDPAGTERHRAKVMDLSAAGARPGQPEATNSWG